MLRIVTGLAAALSGLLMLGLAKPATASETDISSHAFTNHALALVDQPGRDGVVLGQLPGGLQLAVDRCSRQWCHVHGRFGHGWVSLYALSFGHGPNSIWWPGELRHGPYNPWSFWGE
jgi:hypothetical protein